MRFRDRIVAPIPLFKNKNFAALYASCINASVHRPANDSVHCARNFESGIAYKYRSMTEKVRRAGLEPASILACSFRRAHAG